MWKRPFLNKKRRREYDVFKAFKILSKLQKSTKCDRVWFIACRYKIDKSEYRGLREDGTWSGDFEVLSGRLQSHIHRYNHIPTGILWREWKMAEEDGGSGIMDVENYHGPLDGVIHASRGAMSYCSSAVHKNGVFVGVLGCDWVRANAWGYTEACMIETAAREFEEVIKT